MTRSRAESLLCRVLIDSVGLTRRMLARLMRGARPWSTSYMWESDLRTKSAREGEGRKCEAHLVIRGMWV